MPRSLSRFEKSVGRPPGGRATGRVQPTSVKLDDAAREALDELTQEEARPGVRFPKAVAIRRAIIEAAERLRTRKNTSRTGEK